jgi:hypothetical protein
LTDQQFGSLGILEPSPNDSTSQPEHKMEGSSRPDRIILQRITIFKLKMNSLAPTSSTSRLSSGASNTWTEAVNTWTEAVDSRGKVGDSGDQLQKEFCSGSRVDHRVIWSFSPEKRMEISRSITAFRRNHSRAFWDDHYHCHLEGLLVAFCGRHHEVGPCFEWGLHFSPITATSLPSRSSNSPLFWMSKADQNQITARLPRRFAQFHPADFGASIGIRRYA